MEQRESKSEAAQALASLRRKVTGTCVVCGAPFVGTTKRRYCSKRCAYAAHYQAHKAEKMERQRERRSQQKGQPPQEPPAEG